MQRRSVLQRNPKQEPGKGVVKQFVSFLGVGSIATSVHYALLIGLVELLSASPVYASVAGALAGAIVAYFLNKNITFKSDLPHKTALPKFLFVALISAVGNYVFMWLFVDVFSIYYLFAQVVTTILLIAVTFGLNKLWSFKEPASEPERSS